LTRLSTKNSYPVWGHDLSVVALRERPAIPASTRIEIDLCALSAIVERSKAALTAEEHRQLQAAVDTLAFLTRELESKSTSLERLRRFLFGGTEKTSQVLGDPPATSGALLDNPCAAAEATDEPPKKHAGHGKNGADQFSGAKRIRVPHGKLQRAERCPSCAKGKVYPMQQPKVLVRIRGMAPLSATIYECEQLRCNLCGQIFAAASPQGVGEEKYDASAVAMVALLKYGTGFPFNRLEKLQHSLGIPLPAATQWDVVKQAADSLAPVHDELIRQASDGELLHNDDTTARILDLTDKQRAEALGDDVDGRTGVFTSSIVSSREGGHRIALFFTGPKHSGENIAELLKRRDANSPPPIQMCDALAANTSGDFETIVAACMAHGRRHFVEVAGSFPGECRFVLETLRDVYQNDAISKERGMKADERLHFHRAESGPLMDSLERWMREQFAQRKVEPNSGLGEAIQYMQKHWERLTLFLRKPGAPLDNNICERALKKAILHRKNALFFKTLNGARVGDRFMTLIHTAELNGVPPFEYLVALLGNRVQAAANPGAWLPWNYPKDPPAESDSS